MKKKYWSLLIGVSVSAVLLCGGCGQESKKTEGEANKTELSSSTAKNAGETQEEGEKKEPVTISCMVWSYADRTASTDKWIEDCKERFNINIDLQNIPTDNYSATLKTKIAADDMPDIVSVHEITKAYSCESMTIDENTFLDLSELDNVKNFSEEVCDNVSINGKLYYVPISQNALGVLYNKKVFQENGLSIPGNIDEFTELMEQLKGKGVAPLAGSFAEAWSAQIIPFLAFDNYIMGDDPEIAKKLYDSATNTSSMRWSDLGEKADLALGLGKRWLDAGYFTADPLGTDASVACQLLATGKAAMFITGNWEYSVAAAACEEGTEIGFFPLPLNKEGEKIRISTSSNEGLCINANSKNLEAAKTALNYYLSQEMQEAVMADFGGVSTNSFVTSDDPFVEELSKALNDNETVPGGFFGGRDYLYPMDCSFDKEVECQSLFAGLITPKEFCEKMDQAIAETAIVE